MCGIAGKLYLDGQRPVESELIARMTATLTHRGPDGAGQFVRGPVGLGHRRLSIIDLATGAQPLCNEDETVWIVFNGEIYNFPELRDRLIKAGHKFRSASDTEVIVHLYEEHGTDCVRQLRGMFAFAIWDVKQRALFLARDRVGIKPLYICQTTDAVSFASELKALLADPATPRTINRAAIDRFLTFLYLPGHETLFQSIHKLMPGHWLWVKDGRVTQRSYWDLEFRLTNRWRNLDEAAEELNGLLRRTVKEHMISDVPVGFLASGGVDSTALLSYAVEETDKPIQTFTVGFAAEGFADERPFARLAARRFGTRHHELTITAEDFRNFLPRYVWHMEEPVCEPPAIALYHVSKLAREHVKVLLSGEGGDEAFGGYPEYRNYPAFEAGKRLAGPLRDAVGAALRWVGRCQRLSRLEKYGVLMKHPLPDYYFSRVTSPHSYFNRQWGKNGGRAITGPLFARVGEQPLLNQMLYVDTKTWLPDDLLVKADKMTMATSVELRVPFLDHEVLEFAAQLPVEFKVKGRATKRVLKRAFRDRVPQEIIHRPKTGFPVPYARWLRRDLAGFVADRLLDPHAATREYIPRPAVEALLKTDQASEMFSLLVLELWHEQFHHNGTPALVS